MVVLYFRLEASNGDDFGEVSYPDNNNKDTTIGKIPFAILVVNVTTNFMSSVSSTAQVTLHEVGRWVGFCDSPTPHVIVRCFSILVGVLLTSLKLIGHWNIITIHGMLRCFTSNVSIFSIVDISWKVVWPFMIVLSLADSRCGKMDSELDID